MRGKVPLGDVDVVDEVALVGSWFHGEGKGICYYYND